MTDYILSTQRIYNIQPAFNPNKMENLKQQIEDKIKKNSDKIEIEREVNNFDICSQLAFENAAYIKVLLMIAKIEKEAKGG